MTKVTDQDIPPEQQAPFFKIWTPATAPAPPTGTGRTRRAARLRPQKKKYRQDTRWLQKICTEIARSYANTNDKPFSTELAKELYRLALQQIYPEDYWDRLEPISTEHFTTSATSEPDPAPPAYAYRNPTNLPTIPTYEPGAPSAGPPSYNGHTTSGYFEDQSYTWARYHYKAKAPLAPGSSARIIANYVAEIGIATNARPSRPMFSHTVRLRLYNKGDDWETNTDPPHLATGVVFSRYKLPTGTAPYFTYTQPINPTVPIQTRAPTPPAEKYTHLYLDIAPLPMIGRRFNNNTTVRTTVTVSEGPILYLPKIITWPAPQPISTAPIYGYSDMGSTAKTTLPAIPANAGLRTNGVSFLNLIGGFPIKIYDADFVEINSITEYDADGYRARAARCIDGGFFVERQRQDTAAPYTWRRRRDQLDEAGDLVTRVSKTWFANLDQLSDYTRRSIPESCFVQLIGSPCTFYTDDTNTVAGYLYPIPDAWQQTVSKDGLYAVSSAGKLYRADFPTRAQLNPASPPTFEWTLVHDFAFSARVILPDTQGVNVWQLASGWHQWRPSGRVRSYPVTGNENLLSHIWRNCPALPPN